MEQDRYEVDVVVRLKLWAENEQHAKALAYTIMNNKCGGSHESVVEVSEPRSY